VRADVTQGEERPVDVSSGYVRLKHTLSEIALGVIGHPRQARLPAALAAYARMSSRGEGAPLAPIAVAAGVTSAAARRLLVRTGLFAAEDGGRGLALAASFQAVAPYFYRQVTRLEEARRRARAPRPHGIPRVIWNAAAMFNAGLFFECHEYLEDLWRAAEDPKRTFYHGLVQAAAGCYHVEKGNAHGAQTLIGKGAAKLRPYAPAYLGLDVAALVAGLDGVLAALSAVPPRLPRSRAELPVMRTIAH
jgi:hypothetical protein